MSLRDHLTDLRPLRSSSAFRTRWVGTSLAGFGLAAPLWLSLACLMLAGAADTVSVVTRGALVQLEHRTPSAAASPPSTT